MLRVSQAPGTGRTRVAQRPAADAAPARSAHPLRTIAVDIVAPIGLYYGILADNRQSTSPARP